MDPISNADQLVVLLRQKLRERSKIATTARADVPGKTIETGKVSTVQALAAMEGVDERLLRRALVQNFLSEHFGPDMINDAQFQQIVSRVTSAIEDDPDTKNLMAHILSELRSP